MEEKRTMKRVYTITGILLVCQLSCTSMPAKNAPKKANIDSYSAEMVVSFNELVMEIAIEEDGLLTLKGVRTLSMMHLAMHDALNSIHPVYATYAYNKKKTHLNSLSEGEVIDPDPIVSASQAAYEIAVGQYPDQQQRLEQELKRWLNITEDGLSEKIGIELGKAAAIEILQQRESDSWNAEAEYTWHPMGPGVYAEFNEHSGTPEGFVFGSGWAKAKPFMLTSQNQFRAPAPPKIESEEYTKAFNEVKEVGRFESATRTEDQSHLAMWWKDFAENSHNRLARQLVTAENLNLWDATRLFALLNMSIYDAYVNVFDNKFYYNHWRPYTAIRWADKDGNSDTVPDTTWNNLHKHTYAFPSYPSAHGTASGAAMSILADTFGNDFSFTMTTYEVDKAGPFSGKVEMDPPVRSFNSFSEAAMECSISRVYLGIHFRYDSVEGYNLGRQIGLYARENFLRPLKFMR